MSGLSLLAVFSDNRETQSMYMGVGNAYGSKVMFKEKNKTSLAGLIEQNYDLIIVEIMQPVMSEIDFIDQVHGMANGTPIFVVSQFFYDTKDIVFGDKIADFILKPLSIEKLQASINSLLPGFIPAEQALEIAAAEPVVEQKTTTDASYEGKKLSVLLEISRSLNSIKNFDELLHRIIVLAADALNAERATLFILDRDRQELWSRSGIGLESSEIRFPMDKGIAGEVAMSGQVQIIDDPYSHPKFNKDFDVKTGFVTRNILCLPMKNFSDEVIGVFQILNKKEGDFNREDQNFLSAMAANTGIAIENALLQDELKKQLDDVKRSYDELYIAQNAILKETRLVTYTEIESIIRELDTDDGTTAKITKEIRRIYPFDPQLKKYLDQIDAGKSGLGGQLTALLEEKRQSLLT